MADAIRVHAPGRVNLIGDHTDYAGGLAMPMAIDLGTTIEGERGGDRLQLTSDATGGIVDLPLELDHPEDVLPTWGRYPAGVVSELRPTIGFVGRVTTTLPVGAGLSSSAALEVATALALDPTIEPMELALLCQRAEQQASGVPCGVMDQLASVFGRAGHALLIDFASMHIDAVAIPDEAAIVVVHSGEARRLAGSAYAERRAQVEAAQALIGPLRDVSAHALASISDRLLRRRARHVVTENQRVADFASAISSGDLHRAGSLMVDSHNSLRDDFEVSTPALDMLVERLLAEPGVFGARLTGAGFGGCVVALTAPGALPGEGWHVRPADGAH